MIRRPPPITRTRQLDHDIDAEQNSLQAGLTFRSQKFVEYK